MNLHAVQNPESLLELDQLCRVPLQIISPQNNMPVIGICQDSLVGAFLMTDDSVRMKPNQFMQIMMTNSNFDGTMPAPGKDGLYTGKQAISTILPRFNFEYPSDTAPVTIKDGQLLTGRFGKGQLGAKRNTLTHIIFNDYTPEETLRFLDNEQQVVNAWLLQQNGFSVGINDCILTKQQIKDKDEIIETKLNQAVDMLRKAHLNILENKFGKNPSEDFEDQVVQHLNTIREDTKITKRIDVAHNRFLAMTMSGSKGQDKNLGQIMSCLGQQVVAVKQPDRPTFKQQRIPYNYGKIKGGFDGRTLPHFYRHDDTPKARGFCKNSFLVGLDPFEFFFHNASGREGLIDTAIKTADTGYLQRRLIKLMEDGKVYYDGTVRNNSRLILQFDYGCDGFEAIRLESDKICQRVFKMDDDTMLKTFKLSAFEDWTKIVDAKMRAEIKKDGGLEQLLNEEFDEIYTYRNLIRDEIFKHPVGKTGLSAKTCDAIDSQMPINMARLIDNTKHKFRIRKKLSDLNPRYIVDRVSQLMDKVTGVLPEDSEYMKANSRDNRLLHRIILRLHLSTRRVLTEYRLTKDMFDFVIYSIEDGFRRAIAQPGDMVGIIAAQSLGQPTTQMTLNTFHSAGMASQFNVVDGVPRLEELISASAKPKAPAITIYLKPEYMQDEDRAEIVRNKLRQTRLSDLARSSEIVYDPSDENTLLGQDQEFLKSYYAFMKENSCNFDSVWVLRLDLDKEKMLERNIRMWEIEQALLERFTNEIQCVFADDNAKQLTVRIRISNESGMDNPDDDQDVIFLLKQLEKSLMDSLVLRGIEGVKNALIPPREQRPYIERVAEDGGLIDDPDNREIVIVAEQSGVGENSLLEIFKLPEVDEYRTVSNYVGDINTMLGIEAARNMLFREIHRVFSESDINHRHIEMLVDTMTCKGDLTKINRVGIHKLNVGPLARSSFEETETQFMYAAAYAQEDNFQGVSANTMLGQYYPGGTGECEVLLDEDMLVETLKDAPSTIEEEPDEEELALQQDEAAEEEADLEQITESQLGFDFSLD